MKRITIVVPTKKGERWKLSVSGKHRAKGRATATTLLTLLQRSLSASTKREKTSVKVKYDKGHINESLASYNPKEQLWAAACFLEDYIYKATFNKIEREYLKGV